MPPDTLIQIAGPLAMAGWLALALSPLAPRAADRIAAYGVPALLSVAYAALVMAFWTGADGGFGSLAAVMQLFETPEIALAGWLHYLAFDLFVGSWQVRTARAERIPHALVLPCLALTLLFGPAGLLAFLGLRAVFALRPQTTREI